MRRASKASSVQDVQTSDEGALADLGYDQELKRSWGLLQNFGVSFSVIVSYGYCSIALQPIADIHTVRCNRYYHIV